MDEFSVFQESDTKIGGIRVTANCSGVSRVDLFGSNPVLEYPVENKNQNLEATEIAKKALQEILEYLSGKRTVFDIPLNKSSLTSFQRLVLAADENIPFGEIRTYGKIANDLGKPQASRAVGAALGKNPLPILIPCHRVVAANGYLTGYSAADGIRTKQWLLELEGHKIVKQKLVID